MCSWKDIAMNYDYYCYFFFLANKIYIFMCTTYIEILLFLNRAVCGQ